MVRVNQLLRIRLAFAVLALSSRRGINDLHQVAPRGIGADREGGAAIPQARHIVKGYRRNHSLSKKNVNDMQVSFDSLLNITSLIGII